MEVEYKRDSNHNYIILPVKEKADYQLRMILDNDIPGLLSAKTREWNGEEKLYYDISSRQPLSRMYEKTEIGLLELKGIIYSLEDIKQQLRRFLIDEELLIIDPDFCFIEPGEQSVEWIISPAPMDDIREQYTKLGEFILEHTDHADNEARELALEIYRSIKEDRFLVENIIQTMENAKLLIKDSLPAPIDYFQSEKDYSDMQENQVTYYEKTTETWIQKLFGLFKKNDEWMLPSDKKENIEVPKIAGEIRNNTVLDYGKTVVIDVEEKLTKGILVGTGRFDSNRYDVSGEDYVIGSFKERVDIYINSRKVSRMHAKIFRNEEGSYFIQDLNSANGTKKNGIYLDSNEISELKSGDEILFSDTYTYVFE